MADTALEQQLRNEIQHKFQIKSNGKKRKLSFDERFSKKQKLSHNKSKGSMIAELKELGLVQGLKPSKSSSLSSSSSSSSSWNNNHSKNNNYNNYNNHRQSLPQRDNAWKEKKKKKSKNINHQTSTINNNPKKHKIDSLNEYNSSRPTKKRKMNTNHNDTNITNIKRLHHDITIYPFKPYLWYNLDKLLSNDPKLCGLKIKKEDLFPNDNNNNNSFIIYKQIFEIGQTLYNEFVCRDRIKNEFHSFALSKGTFRDKISTWMLRIDQFALTRLNHLDSMINILSQDIKRQSVTIIPLIIELFTLSSPSTHSHRKYNKHQKQKQEQGIKCKGLLPERHLLTFNERLKEIENDDNIFEISQIDLILFYFEHLLKNKYKQFIEILEFYSSNSGIDKLRYQSTLGLWKLLSNKPENELLILNLLINKFGENDKDYTRRITEYLLKVSTKHPMMKPDIIREINNYLMRPSISPRGVYRAIFFLTKLRFTSLENEAATLVCGIYMDLFKQLISYQNVFDALNENNKNNKDNNNNNNNNHHFVDSEIYSHIFDNNKSFINIDNKLNKLNKCASHKNDEFNIMKKLVSMSRKKRAIYFKSHPKELFIWRRLLEFESITPKLLACILRGISYAFPFANLNLKIFKSDLDYIYKLVLKSNMKIALMALQFTFRVESTAETAISGTDITDKTPRQLIKYGKNRMEQSIINTKLTPSDRFYQILYSICSRWDFVIYSHPEMLFNLIYQCIKCDTDKRRITAFVRRLIQFTSYGTVSWICGSLYLFSAILRIHPFLINMLDLTPSKLTNNSYELLEKGNNTTYNLYQYEPKLSNSNLCPFWELTQLTNHMHPAVRQFAKQLLENKQIKYNGDPLKDFQRKVLFEKFTRIMAHKMREFKPRRNTLKQKDKKRLINSYLVGDGFIAIYKQHEKEKKLDIDDINNEDEDDDDDDDEDEEERSNEMDLDEDNADDAILADEAMFKWLKSHYGTEIPDDQFDDDEDYDYSELKEEIEKQEKNNYHHDKDDDDDDDNEDVDVYVSDIERDLDEEEDGEEEEEELDDLEMTEEEKTRIGNQMLLNEIENEDIMLPSDVEYASNDEDEDDDLNMSSKDAKFLEEDEDENEEEEEGDDIGDFFAEDGFSAGQLKID